MPCLWIVLFGLVLCSCSTALSARGAKSKPQPKVRHDSVGAQEHAGAHEAKESESGGGSESDFMADFKGKKRLWVITAPSYSDNYLLMMEKQIAESEGLNCRLAERDTLIVTIIQNAMMEGKIKYPTMEGQATEQSLDSDIVTKLLHLLQLEHQMFSMLIVKKNLKIGDKFPYPVRVEAVLEVIDQLPVRKLEKIARKGSPQKCKVTKKRLVVKQSGIKKRRPPSAQHRGNLTSIFTKRQNLNKKEAIRNKVQDILRGRSRFIIRKPSASPGIGKTAPPIQPGPAPEEVSPKSESGEDKMTFKVENKHHMRVKENKSEARLEGETKEVETVESSKSKKKGKGKKDKDKKKKGKRGGKKSQREADGKEKAAFAEFMEELKGKRRLLVISSPSDLSRQYIQQREENELHSCELALRRVTVLSILGSAQNPTLRLQHYHQDGDPQPVSLPDAVTSSDLITMMRKEYGLQSKDFSMVVTDYDLRPNLGKVFNSATAPSVIIKYIDGFPSRHLEEQDKGAASLCRPSGPGNVAENSLLRFMSKRRLLIVSAPTEDDYSLHQQLQAFIGQECAMGIRHFALVKLIGKGSKASGAIELFPLNGKSQSEKESLTWDVVRNLRDQLKISTEYFSMLVVEKDGDVKAWFPSPVWSLGNIYDLVDSMELRQQEEKLQKTLGIYCLEDGGGAGGETYPGYGEEHEGENLYHRSEK